jgi:rhodanese-related sulfurtransferase
MGLLSALFGGTDINKALDEFRSTEGAVLIDVRGEDEYASSHIPGAINIEANRILDIGSVVDSKDAPIFLYCLTGARSSRTAAALRSAGYTNVKNIGGINRYKGPIEK